MSHKTITMTIKENGALGYDISDNMSLPEALGMIEYTQLILSHTILNLYDSIECDNSKSDVHIDISGVSK